MIGTGGGLEAVNCRILKERERGSRIERATKKGPGLFGPKIDETTQLILTGPAFYSTITSNQVLFFFD